MRSTPASRAAWVSELDDDTGNTSLFSCIWTENWPPGVQEGFDYEWEEGPSAAPLGEALAWARARADRVILRIDGQQWSAGRVPKPSLPEWVGTD